MTQSREQMEALKQTLRTLRAERAPTVEAATAANKQRQAVRREIRAALAKGPATVPALATACALTPREVLWHVAAMRKYGELVEDVQEGDYFTYRLVAAKGEKD